MNQQISIFGKTYKKSVDAFTLIELVVVLSIVGLLLNSSASFLRINTEQRLLTKESKAIEVYINHVKHMAIYRQIPIALIFTQNMQDDDQEKYITLFYYDEMKALWFFTYHVFYEDLYIKSDLNIVLTKQDETEHITKTGLPKKSIAIFFFGDGTYTPFEITLNSEKIAYPRWIITGNGIGTIKTDYETSSYQKY